MCVFSYIGLELELSTIVKRRMMQIAVREKILISYKPQFFREITFKNSVCSKICALNKALFKLRQTCSLDL